MVILSRLAALQYYYPVVRGMSAYAILWPISSIIQQGIEGRDDHIDWPRALRFGLFGSCFVAPTLFMWVKLSTRLWPGNDLATCVKRAVIEQVTYGPFAVTSFYFGMSALEGRPIKQCTEEVKNKFLPTFKMGACVWPAVQTVNNYFVPERNRVMVTGAVSLLWTCFLSHMKSLHVKEDNKAKQQL